MEGKSPKTFDIIVFTKFVYFLFLFGEGLQAGSLFSLWLRACPFLYVPRFDYMTPLIVLRFYKREWDHSLMLRFLG
jgi:hypothetical protein